MWLTSFGAVDRLDLRPGEEHIVDNDHLVAWNCDYSTKKAGGKSSTGLKTGEGLVRRFKGPGSVYVQTQNLGDFMFFIKAVAANGQRVIIIALDRDIRNLFAVAVDCETAIKALKEGSSSDYIVNHTRSSLEFFLKARTALGQA